MRTKGVIYADPADPHIKLTQYRMLIAPKLYEDWGYPERILVSIDEKNKAFRVHESKSGYKVKSLKRETTGEIYAYQAMRMSESKYKTGGQRTDAYESYFGSLPKGLYKPIGGAIFEYVPIPE